MTGLNDLPSVERLLQTEEASRLAAEYGRILTVDGIRSALEVIRTEMKGGGKKTGTKPGDILKRAKSHIQNLTRGTLFPVINASGVILHTNLGRAPLSSAAIASMESIARGYSNLEYDLGSGKRGSRSLHAEEMLKKISGAEAAIVVNNNAAAVLLALTSLAAKRRVVIPRSQLVEIGGGFRVPDVMRQSGAKLVEIGTTNKVRLQDFEEALEEPTALVMRAHRSNFKIVGFTEEPEWRQVIALAHQKGIPCLDDLGSGALLDTERFGLAHEPTVQESLQAGADLVCFSGDKLLGGPQSGIIVGKPEYIARIRKNPLARAVRADKLCLAALASTLLHYLKGEMLEEIPVWKMISDKPTSIKKRAETWAAQLGQGEVIPGESTVGGGSLPGETLPTFLLSLDVKHPDHFLSCLRKCQPPVVARTAGDRILLDPRTVLLDQDQVLLGCLKETI